jgi:peroxiredoxin
MVLEINQLAPEFTLSDLDKRIHMLSDYRGKIVLVNFWSAECPHSKRTDRATMKKFADWEGEVVALSIASNRNESQEMITTIARSRRLPIVLIDSDHAVADRYDAHTTPHVFIVDQKGFLRYRGAVDDVALGQRQATRFFMEEVVQDLLEGREPRIEETLPYGCAIVRYP